MNNPIFLPALNPPMYSFWLGALIFVAIWLIIAYFKHKNNVTKYFALYFIFKVPAIGILMIPNLLLSLGLLTKYNDLAVNSVSISAALMNAITIFWALMLYGLVLPELKKRMGIITAVLLLPFVFLPFFDNISIQADPTGKLVEYQLGLVGLVLFIPHLLLMVPLGIYFLWRINKIGEKNLRTKAGLIGIGLIASGIAGPLNYFSLPIAVKYILFTISQLGHFLILGGVVYALLATHLFLPKKSLKPQESFN